MAASKKIVILGGSYGGVSTAHYLLKHAIPRLPKDGYEIVLVSTSSQVMCRPACPRAMICDEMFDQAKLFVSIAKQFEQYSKDNFAFIHGSATGLDHENRKVSIKLPTGEVEMIEYYALVIATGASTTSPLLGLNGDASELKTRWAEFRKALPTAKSIVISGGGPAGIEVAGEMGEYLNGRPGWFGKSTNSKVSITVYTAGSQILPVLRPSLAKHAEDLLSKLGVTVVKDTRVKSVEVLGGGDVQVTSKVVIKLDDGKTVEADLYIPATGIKPNTGFINKSLLISDGRIDTNQSTLRVDKAGARVYAVGDVSSAARPAVHLILEAVPVLCANIKRDLLLNSGAEKGSVGADRVFKEDTRETQMVPIGKSKGVGAAMGYQLPSFLVWLIKGRDYWLWTTGGLWSGNQWAKEK
ncbi:FAD/NAD(P)-binding domain-containing protein [Cadophora sp. DSE1049]|nr:FAD/NAD(P)-binding domain-containing protein [Cadophora sp. DSE1049]